MRKRKEIRCRHGTGGAGYFNRSISLEVIIYALGLILTVTFITIAVENTRQSRQIVNAAADKLDRIGQDIENYEVMQYDGYSVKGSEVRNFVKKQLISYHHGQGGAGEVSPLQIFLIHKGAADGTNSIVYEDNLYLKDIMDPESPLYVSPASVWLGEVTVNLNGVITAVSFTEK